MLLLDWFLLTEYWHNATFLNNYYNSLHFWCVVSVAHMKDYWPTGKKNLDKQVEKHYKQWLCHAVRGILLAWFRSTCLFRGKDHRKQQHKVVLTDHTYRWWNISTLLVVVFSWMTAYYDCVFSERQDEVVYYDTFESADDITEDDNTEREQLRRLQVSARQLEARRGRITAKRSYLRNKRVCRLYSHSHLFWFL